MLYNVLDYNEMIVIIYVSYNEIVYNVQLQSNPSVSSSRGGEHIEMAVIVPTEVSGQCHNDTVYCYYCSLFFM